jgi:protein TonB
MALGGKTSATILLGMILALAVHGTAAARVAYIAVDLLQWTQAVRLRINDRLAATYEIETLKEEKPPEPPPEPPKEEPKEEVKAPPPAAKEAPKETAPPPPPAAAQAGAVLTQQPDPNEPVDLTNSFISGSSASFAGGVTQAGGTGTQAVYDRNARAGGVPGGTGTAAAPVVAATGPDRSRRPGLSGGRDWSCGNNWPAEADAEQIDEAYVTVEIAVATDGRPTQVNVLQDPGHGFGREAKRCAMRERFEPGLDRDGRPISDKLRVRIRYNR